jgi:hypothetical protein
MQEREGLAAAAAAAAKKRAKEKVEEKDRWGWMGKGAWILSSETSLLAEQKRQHQPKASLAISPQVIAQ